MEKSHSFLKSLIIHSGILTDTTGMNRNNYMESAEKQYTATCYSGGS
jgi:hypothetical protein